MQPDCPCGTARPDILDLHLQGRVDAREAVGESGDQRTVAQIAQRRGRYGIEQLTPFSAFEHRRLAGLQDMLRPAHGRRRVGRQHLVGNPPVEQHPHDRQLLLDARRRMLLLQQELDICRDVKRPDLGEREAALFTLLGPH
jgi:hypothetical protein